MSFWLLLTVNSVTFGGLLFLLSAGFSLIFGLMRIPNLTHGSMFMVGAYLGSTFLSGALGFSLNFWAAAIIGAAYLVMVDDVCRLAFSFELPIGIVTALVGIPCFAFVLRNARKGWS